MRQAALTRDVPVLLVSTTEQLLQEAREQHETFGRDRYPGKPFDLNDLLGLDGELMGKA